MSFFRLNYYFQNIIDLNNTLVKYFIFLFCIISLQSFGQRGKPPWAQDSTKRDSSAKASNAINQTIFYNAEDSIIMSPDAKTVRLYGKAAVKSDDMELKADFIEIDFDKNIINSNGLPDTTGKIVGNPVFTQAKENFKSKKMSYNYKSKKGVIYGVVTEQIGRAHV